MKTFKDYLAEVNEDVNIDDILNESELTEEQEAAIDTAVEKIMEEHASGKNIEEVVDTLESKANIEAKLNGLEH